MAPPPVSIYVTSLTSQPRVRQHIELLRRSLRGLEIPYEEHDLVIDENAKKRWQRSKPPGMVVGLPGYLVGGEWVGTMDDFEEAVETQTLPQFLKQDLDLSAAPPGQTAASSASAPAPGGAGAQKSVQEVELEKLMREMTDADLDKLMGELGVDEKDTKIGLLDAPKAGVSDVKETEKGLLDELKEESRLDDKEDVELKASGLSETDDRSAESAQGTAGPNERQVNPASSVDPGQDQGEGDDINKTLVDESTILADLKAELKADKKEDVALELAGKEKVD